MDPTDELMESMRQAGEDGRKQRAADLAAGRARIGGWLAQPDYLRAYLRAGAALVAHAQATETLDELAVVCGYVQRHALELLIKELIGLFYGIADAHDELARISGEVVASTAPSKNAKDRLTKCHDLEPLLRDLNCARQRAVDVGSQYRELPADLAALVAEFTHLEGGIAETFRYPTVRLRTPEKVHVKTKAGIEEELVTRQRSFKNETIVPISVLQVRLEALVDTLFWRQDDDLSSPIDSLGYELVVEDSELSNELYGRGGLGEVVPAPLPTAP
jgi:hypothetical protein